MWFVDHGDDNDDDAFVSALRASAAQQWSTSWTGPDDAWITEVDARTTIVAVDVVDRERSLVLVTWRADLVDGVVHAGRDPTQQLVGPLGDDAVCIEAASLAALAELTVAWFATQLRRPIDRLEWDEPAVRCWIDVDHDRVIVTGRDGHPPVATAARRIRVAGER